MKKLDNADLMEQLEQLTTPQLDDMLRSELERECPDDETVRAILRILRRRELDMPVETGDRVEAAWQDFRKKTDRKSTGFGKPLLKAAAILVACGLLLAVFTQQTSAGRFWERLAAWSDSIFQLFSREHRGRSSDGYVFRTDNPGLQELYDTVSQLGVTAPVIPMWLDGEYQLVDCKVTELRNYVKVLATFSCGNKTVGAELKIYEEITSSKYHKNEPDAEPYESNGVVHYIFRNHELWTVVWTKGNAECYLSIDCRDDVYRVINSIYVSEE